MKKDLSPARRRKFADAMTQALRRAGETRSIRYDPDQFRLLFGGAAQRAKEMFLAHIYRSYRAAGPVQGAELLRSFAAGTQMPVDVPTSFAMARAHLLPRLACRAGHDLARLCGFPGGAAAERPFAAHLVVGLAVDRPKHSLLVPEDSLQDWGVTFEEALQAATQNLRRQSTRPFASPVPGVYVGVWSDHYDAARLLLTDVLRDHEVRGDHVALVPDRANLILTGAQDRDGLALMLDAAVRTRHNPRPLPPLPLRWRDGRWQPFAPETEFPELLGFKSLRMAYLSDAYEEQRRTLESVGAREESSPHVAEFTVSKIRRTGLPISACSWTEGLTTLLPQTEWVGLCRSSGGNGQVAAGTWERVRQVVGELMVPAEGLYPERYRVAAFPSDAQLTAIGLENLPS